MDLIVGLLLLVVALIALVAILSAVMGVGLGVLAGRVGEALFDLVVPKRRTGLGTEGVVGESGHVVELAPGTGSRGYDGMVQIGGELWQARWAPDGQLRVGQRVRVVAMEKLVVVVAPLDETRGPG